MRRSRRSMLLLLAVALSVSGCVAAARAGVLTSAAPPSKGDARAEISRELAHGIGSFGFSMMRAMYSPGANTVISPFSLESALSVAANGARGATAEEMSRVLTGTEPGALNQDWADFRASLMESGEATFTTADSVWIDEGFPVRNAFLDTNKRYFGVETRQLDLQAPGAPKAINGWVNEETRGRIDKIIDTPSENAALILVNATYFLADWQTPFEHGSTNKEKFTLYDGEKVDADMMHGFGSYDYAENDSLQAVKLPYAGGRYAAYVLVPLAGADLEAILGELPAVWPGLQGSMTTQDGLVAIPRLELDTGIVDVTSYLEDAGMTAAFGGGADFSGISSESLSISRVLHRVYLRVDEKGTEAAASTAVEMLAGAMAADKPFELRADRPFLFLIADEPSGTPLFIAVVSDPR